MKKTAAQKTKDTHRFKHVHNLSKKARRFIIGTSIAAAASLAVHGEVGNQPALGH